MAEAAASGAQAGAQIGVQVAAQAAPPLWRRRGVRLLAWLAGTAVVALLLAAAGLWVWAGRSQSLDAALRLVQARMPAAMTLHADAVTGTLRSGGHIQRLVYTAQGTADAGYSGGALVLTLEDVDMHWDMRRILSGLHVTQLRVATATVHDTRTAAASAPPTSPMQTLTLPVSLSLPLEVGELRILEGNADANNEGYTQNVHSLQGQEEDRDAHGQTRTITRLHARYAYDRRSAQHQVQLSGLHLTQGGMRATLHGTASMDGRAPMHTRVQLQAQADTPALPEQPAQHVQATAEVTGTLSGTDALLHATLRVRPQQRQPEQPTQQTPPAQAAGAAPNIASTHIDIQADIHPWHTQPLAQVQAQWRNVNAHAFVPTAPRTQLQGQLALVPLPAPAGAAPTGSPAGATAGTAADKADGMLGFLGQAHWQLTLEARNTLSGAWDTQRLPLDSASLRAQYHAGALDVSHLALHIGAGSVQAQGRYQPASGWQGQVQVQHLPLAQIHTHLAAAPISGRVQAQPAPTAARLPPAAHSSTPLDFAVQLTSDGGSRAMQRSKAQLALDVVDIQGRWHAPRLALEKVRVQLGDAHLSGTATCTLPAQMAAAPSLSAQADMALVLPGLQASVRGHMAPADGQGRLQLAWSDMRKTQQWLLQWPGTASLRQSPLAGSATLDAHWQGGWQHGGRSMRVHAQLDVPTLHLPASAHNRGTDADTLRITQTRLALNGTLAHALLDASAHLQRGAYSVHTQWRATVGQQAQGWRAQIQAASAQLRTSSQTWQAQLAAVGAQTAAEAAAETTAATSSTTSTTANTTAFPPSTTGIGADAAAATTAPLTLHAQHSAGQWRVHTTPFQIQLGAAAAPQHAAIQFGALRYAQQGSGYTLTSSGRVTDMPLAWLATPGRGLSGDLALSGQWDVQWGQAMRVNATLERSRGDVRILSGTAAGIRTARVHIHGSGRQLQAQMEWNSTHAGTATADIRTQLVQTASGWALAPAAPLSGHVQANLPRVGIWSLFAPPGWRMRGTLQAQATLAGSVGAPVLNGSIHADNVSVRSVVDGIAFHNGTLRTRLSGQRLDIDELTLQGAPVLRQSGGNARISGHVQWSAQGVLMQLQAQLQQLQLFADPDKQIAASGQLGIGLSDQRLSARGDLRIDRALVQIPDSSGAPVLDSDVIIRPSSKHPQAVLASATQAADTDTASTAKRTDTPRARTSNTPTSRIVPDIRITLHMGENLRLRGHGLDTRLNGRLLIEHGATLQDMPRLTGTIHTDRGTYRAYGQELDMEEGHITFSGNTATPQLDITAVRPNLTDMRVGIHVRGTAQRPRVQLFSTPDMPEAEKLSWLVLGRASGGTADAALLQQAALAMLADDRRGVGDTVADALGLDSVTFRGGGDNGISGSSVTLSKRFSKNFYVAYEHGLQATMGTLYFFYDLTRTLKLRGQTGTISAVDLVYTISRD